MARLRPSRAKTSVPTPPSEDIQVRAQENSCSKTFSNEIQTLAAYCIGRYRPAVEDQAAFGPVDSRGNYRYEFTSQDETSEVSAPCWAVLLHPLFGSRISVRTARGIRVRALCKCGEAQVSFAGVAETYQGSGFRVLLPADGSNVTEAEASQVVRQLRADRWIGRKTRAIVVTLNLYCPTTNYVTTVRLLSELPAAGGMISTAHYRHVSFGYLFLEQVLALDHTVPVLCVRGKREVVPRGATDSSHVAKRLLAASLRSPSPRSH